MRNATQQPRFASRLLNAQKVRNGSNLALCLGLRFKHGRDTCLGRIRHAVDLVGALREPLALVDGIGEPIRGDELNMGLLDTLKTDPGGGGESLCDDVSDQVGGEVGLQLAAVPADEVAKRET